MCKNIFFIIRYHEIAHLHMTRSLLFRARELSNYCVYQNNSLQRETTAADMPQTSMQFATSRVKPRELLNYRIRENRILSFRRPFVRDNL